MSVRNAVVVGGGPVGALTAVMLAEQGWKVQVFERASLPSMLPPQQDQRAYRLTLMSRALHVLKLANVNMDPLIASQGQLIEAARYSHDGTKLMSASMPMTKNPQMVRGYRDEIALHIIREAKRLHPQAILFHFNSQIHKVDLDKHTVHASTAEAASAQVPYDLLVGADGAGSVVRSALQQVMPANYMRRYTHKQVYSMAQVTPSNPAQIPQHTVIQLHVVKGGVVLWDGHGSNDCRVGLTVSQEDADALRQGNTDEYLTMLSTSGPSMPDYARKAAIELAQSRPQFFPMPHWTHLSQLHGPKTVLLGDAAHTMSPVLGQGLNAGLEDVAVFAQCLEQHKGHVDTALPAYNRARLPDVQAIMTINEVASSQDSGLASQDQDAAHKMWLFGHKVLFLLHMAVYTMLQKVAPSIFAGPHLKGLISGTLPYRSFLSTIHQDGICFVSFLAAVTALALWVF